MALSRTLFYSGRDGNRPITGDFSPVNAALRYQLLLASDIAAITHTPNCIFVLRSDGTLWAGGTRAYTGLGVGTPDPVTTLTQVGTSSWSQISAGVNDTVGLKADGTLWAWGSNSVGEYGLGDAVARTVPTQIGVGFTWSGMVYGAGAIAAIRSDGTLWFCGTNANGQGGLGHNTNVTVFTQVGSASNWASVSIFNHLLAIKADGTLWACGFGAQARTGFGNQTSTNTLAQVGSATNWSIAVATSAQSFGLRSNGELYSWGGESLGVLGLGPLLDYVGTPTRIGSATWTSFSANNRVVLAIKPDGTLWGWGSDSSFDYYPLGAGVGNYVTEPMQLDLGSQWTIVSASKDGSVATTFSAYNTAAAAFWTNFYGQRDL